MIPLPFEGKPVTPGSQMGEYRFEALIAHTRLASVPCATDLRSGKQKVLGVAADSLHVYMVMEWVQGKSLRDILEENSRFSSDRCIRIGLGIFDALQHIHRHGVVHRGLKSENIMVDSDDRIKLSISESATKLVRAG